MKYIPRAFYNALLGLLYKKYPTTYRNYESKTLDLALD